MATRSPRTRRRATGTPLPRPSAPNDGALTVQSVPSPARSVAPQRPVGSREHHVTNDFSYVRRDLMLVGAVGVVTLGFIIGMSFAVT